MRKALWVNSSSDMHEERYPFKIGDVINVVMDEESHVDLEYASWKVVTDSGNPIKYNSDDDDSLYVVDDDFTCYLYTNQLSFPVKATRLAKKMYPDAKEIDGLLFIKEKDE